MAKAEASRGCSLGGLFLFISPACGYERRAGGLHYADASRGDREDWRGPCRESARGRGRRLRQRHSDMAESYRGGYGRSTDREPNAARQAAGAIPKPERGKKIVLQLFRRARLRCAMVGSRMGTGFSRERSPLSNRPTAGPGGNGFRPKIWWWLLIVSAICGIVGGWR